MYLKFKGKRYLVNKPPRDFKAGTKVRMNYFEVKCSKQLTVDIFRGGDH